MNEKDLNVSLFAIRRLALRGVANSEGRSAVGVGETRYKGGFRYKGFFGNGSQDSITGLCQVGDSAQRLPDSGRFGHFLKLYDSSDESWTHPLRICSRLCLNWLHCRCWMLLKDNLDWQKRRSLWTPCLVLWSNFEISLLTWLPYWPLLIIYNFDNAWANDM